MRTIQKIVVYFILLIFALATISYAFLYYWFHNKIENVLSKSQQEWLINDIANSPELPDSFYNTIEKYFPEPYEEHTWNASVKHFLGIKSNHCQCNELYLFFIDGKPLEERKWIPFGKDDIVIKLFIEQIFSQKECLRYNMNSSEFAYGINGISELSKFFYNKELKDLNEREIIGLYMNQFAPSTYNPIKNKEKFDKVIETVIKRKEKRSFNNTLFSIYNSMWFILYYTATLYS